MSGARPCRDVWGANAIRPYMYQAKFAGVRRRPRPDSPASEDAPDVEAARKAIDPEKHDVNDRTKRPDKRVAVSDSEESSGLQVTSDVPGGSKGTTRPEPVARISLAIQQLIIKRAVSFLFGNDPAYNTDTESEQQQAVMRAFGRILRDVKCNSINRRVGRLRTPAKFAWYLCVGAASAEAESNRYGFPSRFKLRCAVFSPATGDTLYPYFDETGDMMAFSRSFARKDDAGNTVDFFETYTADAHYMWQSGDNGWTPSEGYPRAVAIGKIPVVYARQDETETAAVNSLIARLETLLSNFADTNDYHASPKLFITGHIQGFSKKGEAGGRLRTPAKFAWYLCVGAASAEAGTFGRGRLRTPANFA